MDVTLQTSNFLSQAEQLPQEVLEVIRNGSNAEYLSGIAMLAAMPRYTDTILVSLNDLIVEITARLATSSDIRITLPAFGRILHFAPSLAELVEAYLLRQCPEGCLPPVSDAQDDDAGVCERLLALHRLLVFDERSLRRLVKLEHLHSYLSHGSRPVRYLAIRCLCICLQAADAAMQKMIDIHLEQDAVSGPWEGKIIDYRFFSLWEERRYLDVFAALGHRLSRIELPAPSIPPRFIHDQDWSVSTACLNGVLLPRARNDTDSDFGRRLVPVPSTMQNLKGFATALLKSKPVILEGPPGSGKSLLVDHVAQQLRKLDSMVTLHLNEQSDAKLLIGMYSTGAAHGSFKWQPGVLTTAVMEGRWVLLENLDRAPSEIIGTLLPLIEHRELFIASRKETIKAAHGFRIIATVTTVIDLQGHESSRTANMLGARLWNRVAVQGLTSLEIGTVVEQLYPVLKEHLSSILAVYTNVLRLTSSRLFASRARASLTRPITIRELLRWCERVSRALQRSGTYSSSTIDDMFLGAYECFTGANPDAHLCQSIASVIAEELHLDPARRDYLTTQRSVAVEDESSGSAVRIGRALLDRFASSRKTLAQSRRRPFAQTEHSLRVLEQIAISVDCCESLLLVGETGTGKTTVIQYLADRLGRKLVPFNLSQQSESDDLLGGFKPTNIRALMVQYKEEFDHLFETTFGQKKNRKFLELLGKYFAQSKWQQVCKMWSGALQMVEELQRKPIEQRGGYHPKKRQKMEAGVSTASSQQATSARWAQFASDTKVLEAQLTHRSNAVAFSFVESNIVKAVRNGDWVLLDEINLASPDTLEALADLFNGDSGANRSILLSETGSVERIRAHPDFRLFAAMNPATDVGKKDLPPAIRSRFTEVFVFGPDKDIKSLQSIIASYLGDTSDRSVVADVASLYLEIQRLAESNELVDGAGQKPHFSLRTLTGCLVYAQDMSRSCSLRRALLEGFQMSFSTFLDARSDSLLSPTIWNYLFGKHPNARSELRRPLSKPEDNRSYVQLGQYWLRTGGCAIHDQPDYIITPFVRRNLDNLIRSASTRRFPILIQGPTSSGKTSMIEYVANMSGNRFVRINNHEHTDLQEYLGTYVSDSQGKLRFQEGILVQALREGSWIVLDELNLAPSDVLEALNRLLDDNRELLIPETQEVVKPHENFMLFATQNPAGLYGGRKMLSRAFRNRFLELHFDDIPVDELQEILHRRTQIPESWCRRIVEVYRELSNLRQESRMFEQKSFATLRDLFRWAQRKADSVEELAINGFMLLAERVRKPEERDAVREIIEKVMRSRGPKVQILEDRVYGAETLAGLLGLSKSDDSGVVLTRSTRRLILLVARAMSNNEPVLLVGETGCGKTTICQLVARMMGKTLRIVNAHQNTETGDLIGAQRPVRNRSIIEEQLRNHLLQALRPIQTATSNEATTKDLLQKFESLDQSGLASIPIDLQKALGELKQKSNALFEWSDGAIAEAMRAGDHFLLDEISLADDSVLERLNSVLEPRRSLLLAEKGPSDPLIVAADGFQFLATMNPGGDFGKRELSPALRNRFTEIWVPPLSDSEDILQITQAKLAAPVASYAPAMVAFAQWFHANYNVSASTSVSVRDMMAWIDFVRQVNGLAVTSAIVHGAAMVYIDTLGANPAAILSLAASSIGAEKQRCIEKLADLLQIDARAVYFETPNLVLSDDRFKIGPFSIPRHVSSETQDSFAFHATTTTMNAMRVLRALQLPKPMLLEGNPGVGKTSLVAAIASACGIRLERMNLSEQTDIMDLFGSDAPMEDQQVGSFEWRDGQFLAAMKRGDWVLLDEMNLASQAVLEGLNACLDHRGEVYVAELDQTFQKHPDFRLFAAQNPHHQGGGRKGLPASFVNRFTVVHVDVFQPEDFMVICKQDFPSADDAQIRSLVSFVNDLSHNVTHLRRFGAAGGPWEFNLRDIIRWIELAEPSNGLLFKQGSFDELELLFAQRFRTQADVSCVRDLLRHHFPTISCERQLYHTLSMSFFQVGACIMERDRMSCPAPTLASQLPKMLLRFMESVMICIRRAWPVVLVGPTSSGKSTIIHSLATIVGARLTTLSMHADVDATDLIGGYEQTDASMKVQALMRKTWQVLQELQVQHSCMGGSSELARRLLALTDQLNAGGPSPAECLSAATSCLLHLREISGWNADALLRECGELEASLQTAESARFEWADGTLIEAVEHGHWLVLDNANLCSSSVLDRLNSLLEKGGYLAVSENVSPTGEARMIRPHPKFRIFLTMDPRHGELSRAMRNRAVELYIPTHADAWPNGSHISSFINDSSMSRFREFFHVKPEGSFLERQIEMDQMAQHLSTSDASLVHTFQEQGKIGLLKASYMLDLSLRGLTSLPSAVVRDVVDVYLTALDGPDRPRGFVDAQAVNPLNNGPLVRVKAQVLERARTLATAFEVTLAFVAMEDALGAVRARTNQGDSMTLLERALKSSRTSEPRKTGASDVTHILLTILDYLKLWASSNFENEAAALMSGLERIEPYRSSEPVLRLMIWLQDLVALWWTLLEHADTRTPDLATIRNFSTVFRKTVQFSIGGGQSLAGQSLSIRLGRRNENDGIAQRGVSLDRLWTSLRPECPERYDQLQKLLNLEELEGSLNRLALRLDVTLPEALQLKRSLERARAIVFESYADTEPLLDAVNKTVHGIGMQAPDAAVEAYFDPELRCILQKVQSQSYGFLISADTKDLMTMIATLAQVPQSVPTLPGIPRYLQAASSVTQGSDADTEHIASLIGQNFGQRALRKVYGMGNVQLRQLPLLREEAQAFGKSLSLWADLLCRDEMQILDNTLESLLSLVADTHSDIIVANGVLESFSTIKDRSQVTQATMPTAQRQPLGAFLESSLTPVAQYLRSTCLPKNTRLKDAAASWIAVGVTLLHVFLPEHPVDPSTHLLLLRDIFRRKQTNSTAYVRALQDFERKFSGSSTSLVIESAKQLLSSLGAEPVVPLIARPAVSQLQALSEDFQTLYRLSDSLAGNAISSWDVRGIRLARGNLYRLWRRLSSAYRSYDDIVRPLLSFMVTLDTGLALSEQAHETERNGDMLAIIATHPAVYRPKAGTNLVDIWPTLETDFPSNTSVQHRLLALEMLSLHLSLRADAAQRAIGLRVANDHLGAIYDHWKMRLEKQRQDHAANSSLYSFRANHEASQEIEDAEFEQLFAAEDRGLPPNATETFSMSQHQLTLETCRLHAELTLGSTDVTKTLAQSLKKCMECWLEDQHFEQRSISIEDGFSALLLELDQKIHTLQPSETRFQNFYKGENIFEVQKLNELTARIRQRFNGLHERWPEHATPLDVLRHIEELLAFSVSDPIAKYLTKAQQLHATVHEWQRVASREYSATDLYDELTTLIIGWRQLELRTWARLFDDEVERSNNEAKSWWFVAYENLAVAPIELSRNGVPLESHVSSLLQTLQDFFTTATLGQYEARLKLLHQFREHTAAQASIEPVYGSLLAAIENFISHFTPFVQPIRAAIAQARQPLETSIKDVILLASWKDTTIEALHQSAKASHRKLFTIVRKFRDILNRPATTILSQWPQKTITPALPSGGAPRPTLHANITAQAVKLCEVSLPTWTSRPSRFKSTAATVALITELCHAEGDIDFSAECLESYRTSWVDSSKKLQSETPSKLTDDNSDTVKHLRTRKRRLFADILKGLRSMGLSSNPPEAVLRNQSSTSSVLSSLASPLLAWAPDSPGDQDYHLHKMIHLMDDVRASKSQHSGDLTSNEVSRSVGLLEDALRLLIRQQRELSSAAHANATFSTIVDQMRNSAESLGSLLPDTNTENAQADVLEHQFDALVPISAFLGRLLEIQARFGGPDCHPIATTLYKWSDKFLTQRATLKAKQTLLPGIINQGLKARTEEALSLLSQVRVELEATLVERPQTKPILQCFRPWLSPETHRVLPSLNVAKVHTNVGDFCQQLDKTVDFMLGAIQDVGKPLAKLNNGVDDKAWLVANSELLSTAVRAFRADRIASMLGTTFGLLSGCSPYDLQISVALTVTILPIIQAYQEGFKQAVLHLDKFHRSFSHLSAELAELFLLVRDKGFCTPSDQTSGQDGQGDQLEGGTGLGDGEGAEDISKDVGADEDLTDLANEHREDKGDEDIEDEKDAVDMADEEMAGEFGDKPEDSGEDDDASGKDEKDLEDEVGDVDDLGPSSIDEKMWDDGQQADTEREREDDRGKGIEGENEEAPQGQEKPREQEEGEDVEDETTADEDANGVETEPLDPRAEEGTTLDIPDDLQLEGKDEEMSDIAESDDMSELNEQDGEVASPSGSDELQQDDETASQASISPLDNKVQQVDEAAQNIDDAEELEEGAKDDDSSPPPEDEGNLALQGEDMDTGDTGVESDERSKGGQTKQQDAQKDADTETKTAVQSHQGGQPNPDDAEGVGEARSAAMGEQTAQEPGHDDSVQKEQQPFRQIGDSFEQWFRQHRDIRPTTQDDRAKDLPEDTEMTDADFEHLPNTDSHSDAQALGAATEDQTHAVDESMAIDMPDRESAEMRQTVEENDDEPGTDTNLNGPDNVSDQRARDSTKAARREDAKAQTFVGRETDDRGHEDQDADDRSDIESEVEDVDTQLSTINLEEQPEHAVRSRDEARALWGQHEASTRNLALALTEQLRLILAPTLAAKMRGDFRTGKRLNIKRIIPYIASQYKRDKIWMRRSVPSKRSYQIMLALDDSESMSESESVQLAFETLAMVARSLTMLEAGEISVVKFGADVEVAHAFGQPFSPEAGIEVLSRFGFTQQKTDVRALITRSLEIFQEARLRASGTTAELWQLQLVISDGICEDHSTIQRLVRQAQEERIMVVFIVVDAVFKMTPAEDQTPKSQSITELQTAEFTTDANGEMKLVRRKYLDTFPFRWWIVVRDIKELPGVLATALRQWFAEVADSA